MTRAAGTTVAAFTARTTLTALATGTAIAAFATRTRATVAARTCLTLHIAFGLGHE